MNDQMILVLLAGLVVFLLGLTMIIVAAFKYRVVWGVLLLVVPLIYPLYAFLQWREGLVRNGFLISVVGLLITVVGLYGGAGYAIQQLVQENAELKPLAAILGRLPTAGPPAGPLSNAGAIEGQGEDGSPYDPLLSEDAYGFTDIEPLPPSQDERVAVPAEPRSDKRAFQPVELDLASEFVGFPMRVTLVSGKQVEGKLLAVKASSVIVESVVKGGTAAFEYSQPSIAELQIYADPGAVRRARSQDPNNTGNPQ